MAADPAAAIVFQADDPVDDAVVPHAVVQAAHAVPAALALAEARPEFLALVAPQVVQRPLPADVDLFAQALLA